MRVRDLQILVSSCVILAGLLIAVSGWIAKNETLDPLKRPILAWRPKLTLDGKVRILENTEFIEALKRPLFRFNRKSFDPAQIAQPVAEIAPPSLPPQPVAPPIQPQVVEQIVTAPAAIAPAPTPPAAPQFVLKGLSIIDGKKRALITTPEKPDGQWLLVGGSLAGWTLHRLDNNTIDLKLDEQIVTLSLYVDNDTKSVGSP